MTLGKLLAGFAPFKGLDEKQIERLAAISALKTYEKDQTVFENDAVGSTVFALVEGRVRLWLPTLSGEFSFVVGQIRKGELLGLSPLLGTARHTTTARCVEPTTILEIDANSLRRLMEEEPAVGYVVMRAASQAYFARYTESLRRFQSILSHIAAPS